MFNMYSASFISTNYFKDIDQTPNTLDELSRRKINKLKRGKINNLKLNTKENRRTMIDISFYKNDIPGVYCWNRKISFRMAYLDIGDEDEDGGQNYEYHNKYPEYLEYYTYKNKEYYR